MTIEPGRAGGAPNTNNAWSYFGWHDGPDCVVGIVSDGTSLYMYCGTCRHIAQAPGAAHRITYAQARVVRTEPSPP